MKQLDEKEINKAIELLKNNEIVILPTDTIYGLSAIVSTENEKRINKIKNSNKSKPLIILISNIEQAKQFVDVDENFVKYINSDYPTTVISKRKDNDKTYALRIPKRGDIKKIIDVTGPIYSTSVNKSGSKNLTQNHELLLFSTEVSEVFFTEILDGNPSNILNLLDFSKKRWQI